MAFKIVLLVASMAVASQASNNLWACPGNENFLFQFVNGSIPDVFHFPGTASWSFHSIRKVDMPLDLVMDYKLKKTAPYPYDVPCLAGQGSCVYDVCDPQYFTAEVCAQQHKNPITSYSPAYSYGGLGLGLGLPYAIAGRCGCPLRAGEARLDNIHWTLPELGLAHAVVRGDYEGQATFYGKSRPDLILGCVNMKFSVA